MKTQNYKDCEIKNLCPSKMRRLSEILHYLYYYVQENYLPVDDQSYNMPPFLFPSIFLDYPSVKFFRCSLIFNSSVHLRCFRSSCVSQPVIILSSARSKCQKIFFKFVLFLRSSSKNKSAIFWNIGCVFYRPEQCSPKSC